MIKKSDMVRNLVATGQYMNASTNPLVKTRRQELLKV